MSSEQRMKELIARLNEASDAYYSGRGERMTDYEWDALFDELSRLEEESGIRLPDSPTQRVSEEAIPGQKEAHEFPALSLAKTKQTADLVRWAEGRPVWISWKLDGLTLVATYDEGKLTRVLTRGRGDVGTNITHLAGAIEGIPRTIAQGGHLVIRGEAVISYRDFEQFLLDSGEDYANPRNLASGSLSLKDSAEVARRKIHWIPFTLVHTDEELVSWGERMNLLEKLGFTPVEREELLHPDGSSLEAAVARWTEKVTGGQNPYPVDGLVITYDDTDYAATGSVTGHHAARAGYAFKWQDESASTRLEKIEWSCAASTITPVAIFAPVELEGTTVRRASLCNVSECERLGIGGAGTAISVIKANKIIPKVIRVEQTVGSLDIPEKCPVCGEQTEVRVGAQSGVKTLHCTNPACAAKQRKKFERFVSKEAVDIDGMSGQTIARFIAEGWIRDYVDLFHLVDEHRGDILQMEGFGEKSVANLEAAVEKARGTTARRFLYGLSIPLVGQEVAKLFLSAYPLRELIETARGTEDPEIFTGIPGIGPEISASFVRWMQEPENRHVLDRLLAEIRPEEESKGAGDARCDGLVFVVTGDVHIYKNRKELKAYIEAQGGKVTGSVSGATSFLINNDAGSASSKNRKAKELGIPVLTEEEFVARFG